MNAKWHKADHGQINYEKEQGKSSGLTLNSNRFGSLLISPDFQSQFFKFSSSKLPSYSLVWTNYDVFVFYTYVESINQPRNCLEHCVIKACK